MLHRTPFLHPEYVSVCCILLTAKDLSKLVLLVVLVGGGWSLGPICLAEPVGTIESCESGRHIIGTHLADRCSETRQECQGSHITPLPTLLDQLDSHSTEDQSRPQM